MLALCALLQNSLDDAFEAVADAWRLLCGGSSEQLVQCDEVWRAEDRRKHHHRVMALLHGSLDNGKFPRVEQEKEIVDLFFQLRSISGTSEDLCSVAACLANGGLNPWTGQQICKSENAKHMLSLLYSAGCETQSGEFSFQVGVPAKSSREGVIMLVIPNLAVVCVAGPSLNRHGVSKGGLQFCFAFSELFNCHALSGASTTAAKYDPTIYSFHTDMSLCSELLDAAESGNLHSLKMLTSIGFDVNYADYDGRSAGTWPRARDIARC